MAEKLVHYLYENGLPFLVLLQLNLFARKVHGDGTNSAQNN